ncbi:hypothetical protein [Pseudomonas putida]|uniref:hypothetical protein n=1 Tax=Pseudomonas putida TaxID=303 RepID=UPI0002FD553D|nr:hypothetical protein [Pseudomonas putida]
MATGAESLQLFNQLVASANSLFLSDEDFVTINGITKPTLKKIYAEFLASVGVYTTVAEGLANTNGTGTNNRFFSVPATGDKAETRYRNDAGTAVEINSILSFLADALTINRGKAFPLKAMTRAGGVSSANDVLNRLVLSVRVVGDAQYLQGKYLRIAYFQNGANIGGNTGNGIVLEECDAATYATTGTAVTIHNYTDGDPGINRAGGVQTFSVVPAKRPKLRFIITIDAAALPAAGTPVNALTSPFGGFSWIIEQSGYLAIQGMGDSISINRYRVFPQKASARNNATSAEPSLFMACILDMQVNGARPGKLYRAAYFKNGTQALGGPPDGWIFEEFDALNYETAANASLTVVNYTDAAPTITRSGIQTVVINSPVVAGLSFRVTLDTSLFPAYGTPIASNLSFQDGYSYIIDPQRYIVATAASTSTLPVQWSLDNSGNLPLAWASKDSCYRARFGLLGVNQVPNILSTSWAPGADLSNAVWVILNTTGSDYLPPMQVAAQQNGDGGAIAFTGGAHGSNGDGTGNPTARNVLYQAFADGQPILPGTSGRAACVTIYIVNELMGYNTKTLGRYILRQSFVIDVTPSGIVVTADITALEPISVMTDYGLQGITYGYQGTQLVLGGQNTERVPFVNGAQSQSGPKSAFPNAWAVVLQEPTHGQMTLWMDKSYADGDGKYVDPAGVLVRGENSTKWYLGVVLPAISGTQTPHDFAAGTGYKYRAGLSWQSNGMQPTGYDSLIALKIKGENTFAYGLPDGSFVRVS